MANPFCCLAYDNHRRKKITRSVVSNFPFSHSPAKGLWPFNLISYLVSINPYFQLSNNTSNKLHRWHLFTQPKGSPTCKSRRVYPFSHNNSARLRNSPCSRISPDTSRVLWLFNYKTKLPLVVQQVTYSVCTVVPMQQSPLPRRSRKLQPLWN